jgi:type II secretory pathway predicted ATPase ExeA
METAMDPFGATCDPRLYVPRLDSEAALTSLHEGLVAGRRVLALSGPPGLGKTMVLRMLAAQLRGARCVYVPYAALAIEELAQVVLDAVGESAPHAEAVSTLAAYAKQTLGEPLVLLLDDASALPGATARALRQQADALDGALRLVAAAVDDARAAAAIAALGDDILHVRLRHPMTPPEVGAYVRGRIDRAGIDAAEHALHDEQIERLAAESAGVPRDVNTLATLMLRAQSEAEEAVARVLDAEGEGEIGASGERGAEAEGGSSEKDGRLAPVEPAGSSPTDLARSQPGTSSADALTVDSMALRDPGSQAEAPFERGASEGGPSAPEAGATSPTPATPTTASPEASDAPPRPRRRRRLRRHRGWY